MLNGIVRDRRKYQRLACNFSISYQVYDPLSIRGMFWPVPKEATLTDVGRGGLGMVSREWIPDWTVLLLQFNMFNTDTTGKVFWKQPQEIYAEVCSCTLISPGEYRLGVKFLTVPATGEELNRMLVRM